MAAYPINSVQTPESQIQYGQYQPKNSGFCTPQASQNLTSLGYSYMQALNQGSPTLTQQPLQCLPNQIPSDQFSALLQRLDSIDKRLLQLDKIQSTIDNITVNLYKVDQRVSEVENKLLELENSRDYGPYSETIPNLYLDSNSRKVTSSNAGVDCR
jgi:hypothetical protein